MSEKVWTTYWFDFTEAEALSKDAVRPAYDKALADAGNDPKLLGELVCALMRKTIWWGKENRELAALYQELQEDAHTHAVEVLDGDDLAYYLNRLFEEGRNSVG